MYYEPSQALHPFIFTEKYTVEGCDEFEDPDPNTYYNIFDLNDITELIECNWTIDCVDTSIDGCLFEVKCNNIFNWTLSFTIPVEGMTDDELADKLPPSIYYLIYCGEDGFCDCDEVSTSLGISCPVAPNPLIVDDSPSQIQDATSLGLTKQKFQTGSNFTINSYPNPFSNELNIEIMTKEASTASIRVYNILGETIWESQKYLGVGINKYTWLPTQSVSSGFYQLEIRDELGNVATSNVVFTASQ